MTARPTVAVALHDGFYGAGTGAGYANHGFLQILVGLLSPAVSSPQYQADWHRRSLDICEQVGASVLPVDNGTGGQIRFGGVPTFRHLAVTTAAALQTAVLPSAGPLAAVLFDVPFLGVPPLLPIAIVPQVAVVVRSTGLLHDPRYRARIEFERSGLHYIAAHHGRVVAISRYMREHLARDYAVPAAALASLPDGLAPTEWYEHPQQPVLPPRACPGFLLALGRAQPYKGWDDLLDALAALRGRRPAVPHALLAAVTDQPTPTVYQRQLAARIGELGIDATLLTRFDPGIRGLLAHPALRAVVVPSRTEPFGRIPMEAYAAGAAPVIATTAGGLAEQVIDGVTGLSASPADPASLAAAIDRALSLSADQREHMRAAGRDLAITRFDQTSAIRQFFAQFAPWACRDVGNHLASGTSSAR